MRRCQGLRLKRVLMEFTVTVTDEAAHIGFNPSKADKNPPTASLHCVDMGAVPIVNIPVLAVLCITRTPLDAGVTGVTFVEIDFVNGVLGRILRVLGQLDLI